MICINCFTSKTSVTNSRPHKTHASTWRRRQCSSCQAIFTTYERPSLEDTLVLAEDGSSAAFSRSKLCLSLADALQHNTTAMQLHSLALAETVEQLLLLEVRQPSVADIAATAHQVLKRFDELAALQYAAKHELIHTIRRRGRPSVTSA